ncbi:MAG: DEAD/DEAH box helicase [Ferruginibacter sp.]
MNNDNINLPHILNRFGFNALNEMQEASIASIDQNAETILMANTGSGKTLAYLIPLIARLQKENSNVQALILAPSRELAQQIDEVYRKIQSGFKVTCCYGGHKREIEENSLKTIPSVIIGTTGRIADHIRRKNFDPSTIHFLVIDEYDKMLELGFTEEMKFIVESLTNLDRKVLVSATAESALSPFLKISNPSLVTFNSPIIEKPEADELVVMSLKSPTEEKLETAFKLLCHINNKSSIVFCNHRETVERVHQYFLDHGLVSVFYHGAMEQHDREVAMVKFKNGTSNILVTTDLASRGLDIADLKYVIHYQLPTTEAILTHRNGRTARMEAGGKSILLLSGKEYIPPYITTEVVEYQLPDHVEVPEKPKWSTLFIDAGKKDKVNKIDVVGFLSQKGNLKKEDLGLVEIWDFTAFAAIRKNKIGAVLELIKDEKIKNKKVKMAIAR